MFNTVITEGMGVDSMLEMLGFPEGDARRALELFLPDVDRLSPDQVAVSVVGLLEKGMIRPHPLANTRRHLQALAARRLREDWKLIPIRLISWVMRDQMVLLLLPPVRAVFCTAAADDGGNDSRKNSGFIPLHRMEDEIVRHLVRRAENPEDGASVMLLHVDPDVISALERMEAGIDDFHSFLPVDLMTGVSNSVPGVSGGSFSFHRAEYPPPGWLLSLRVSAVYHMALIWRAAAVSGIRAGFSISTALASRSALDRFAQSLLQRVQEIWSRTLRPDAFPNPPRR